MVTDLEIVVLKLDLLISLASARPDGHINLDISSKTMKEICFRNMDPTGNLHNENSRRLKSSLEEPHKSKEHSTV